MKDFDLFSSKLERYFTFDQFSGLKIANVRIIDLREILGFFSTRRRQCANPAQKSLKTELRQSD